MVQQTLEDDSLFIIETSWSHSDTPHLVGILWTSDKPDADTITSTRKHTTLTRDRHPCPPEGERPKTYTLDRAVTVSAISHDTIILLFSLALQSSGLWPPRPRGFLITHNDAPQSVGPLWTTDQLVAETYTWQNTTHTHTHTHTQQTNIHDPVGFETTIAEGKRL
jgi:hypothetical protein